MKQTIETDNEVLRHVEQPHLPKLLYQNSRNAVYEIFGKDGRTYILKKALPNPNYPFLRTVSFYLRNFFKDYGRSAHKGADLLKKNNIRTLTPIAHWKERLGPFRLESRFLYEKVEAHFSARDIFERRIDNPLINDSLFRKELFSATIAVSQKIHAAKILHGDLVSNNFLVFLTPSGEYGSKNRFTLTVIDTDHVKRNFLPGRVLRNALSTHCFRRIPLPPHKRQEYLHSYFGKNYLPLYSSSLEFWRWLDKRPISQLRKRVFAQLSKL